MSTDNQPKPLPTVDEIVATVAKEFPTFGGGRGSQFNPLAAMLKDSPPTFAAGVPVHDVVRRIYEMILAPVVEQNRAMANRLSALTSTGRELLHEIKDMGEV